MSSEEAIKTGNDAAKRIVEEQDRTKDEVNKLFQKAFKDPEIGTAFAYEAMTGFEKFGGKAFNKGKGDTVGEATHMVIWDYKNSPFLSSFNPLVKEQRSGADLFYFDRGDKIKIAADSFSLEISE